MHGDRDVAIYFKASSAVFKGRVGLKVNTDKSKLFSCGIDQELWGDI